MSNPLTADMLTATDQIYLSLWNQICSLDLLPGEKLSEVRLAAEINHKPLLRSHDLHL